MTATADVALTPHTAGILAATMILQITTYAERVGYIARIWTSIQHEPDPYNVSYMSQSAIPSLAHHDTTLTAFLSVAVDLLNETGPDILSEPQRVSLLEACDRYLLSADLFAHIVSEWNNSPYVRD